MIKGTCITFTIQLASERTVKNVFDSFTGDENNDYEFNKTRITVNYINSAKIYFPVLKQRE
ncbi:hypothetical protein COY25_00935 [Candidatus Uhrbacteria bacterium CG_4_10_14_0_2_um_filter_41_7]|nr:MAG: hypothetical protein COY25_00935 [Candidatus Uhrbacteria bacterium CG_4_10_14_0_2_um_filter_41_7]